MVAVIMYAGMEGSPIPKIIQVTMEKNKVKIKLLPPIAIIVLAMVRPKPVLEDTPMIIPTQAQASATDTVCLVPSTNESHKSLKDIRVDFLVAATRMVTMMV